MKSTTLMFLSLLLLGVFSASASALLAPSPQSLLLAAATTYNLSGTTDDCRLFAADFGLSLSTASPCTCQRLQYNIPKNDHQDASRSATFTASIVCSNAHVADVRTVMSRADFVPALPIQFSAAFNVTELFVYYELELWRMTAQLTNDSFKALFAETPLTVPPYVQAFIRQVIIDTPLTMDALVTPQSSALKFLAPQFARLASVIVRNDNSITALPADTVLVLAPNAGDAVEPVEIIFENNVNLNFVNDLAFSQLGQQRPINMLGITHSKLNSIPYGLLRQSFGTLRMLNLSNNWISTASVPATPVAVLLPQIQSIDLSRNAIRQLDASALWNYNWQELQLTPPRWIDLHGNLVSIIADDAFVAYSSNVSSLTLHNNFWIDLSHNLLQQVPNFTRAIANNVRVNLSSNEISIIPRHAFSDTWLELQTANVSSLFAGNPFICDESAFGWFACYVQHQLGALNVEPVPPLMCRHPFTTSVTTTTNWVVSQLAPDGTCHYYFPFDTMFPDITTTPTPPVTQAPIIPSDSCTYYAQYGLDFSQRIVWPCTCTGIVSVDLPCGASQNCSRADCIAPTDANFIVSVECANADTQRVQAALQQMNYPLSDQFRAKFGVENLRVFHEVILRDIFVNSDIWQNETTSWNDLLNSTQMSPANLSSSYSSIEGVTFAGSTLNDGVGGKSLQLNFGSGLFSAVETIAFVNMTWLQQLPAMFIASLAPSDAVVAPCTDDGFIDIVIDNTSLSTIDDLAFAGLLSVRPTPLLSITSSQLQLIPFGALRIFNETDGLDFSNNQITSVDNPNAAFSAPLVYGTIRLSNNKLTQLGDMSFWNFLSTPDPNATSYVPHSIVLDHNAIGIVSANAFNVFSGAGWPPTRNGTLIDLSYNMLSDTTSENFPILSDNVEVQLSSNRIGQIHRADFRPNTWLVALEPEDFANQLNLQCDYDDFAWFGCWAQHMAQPKNDDLHYLVCRDAAHNGKTVQTVVMEEFNENGVCHGFFPNDTQFDAVYPCNQFQGYNLDFSTTFAAPCSCDVISSASIDPVNQNATLVVHLTCDSGTTDELKASWTNGMSSTLLTPAFAGPFNVSHLTIVYDIVLKNIHLASAASIWNDVLDIPVNVNSDVTRTVVGVNSIKFESCDLSSNAQQQHLMFNLNFASDMFDALNEINITDAPNLTSLPMNAIVLPATRNSDRTFTLIFDHTNINQLDVYALRAISYVRQRLDLYITNSALTLIPYESLRDFNQSLIGLHLQHNKITDAEYVHRGSSNPMPVPTITNILDLSNNFVTKLNDTYWNHLASPPPTLLVLDSNQIRVVYDNAFSAYNNSTTDIHVISLRNNLLFQTPSPTKTLGANTAVLLTENLITTISANDLGDAQQESALSNAVEMFAGNPLKCSKDLIWFACWAQHKSHSLATIPIGVINCTTTVSARFTVTRSLTEMVVQNMAACAAAFPNEPMFSDGSTSTTTTTSPPPTTTHSNAADASLTHQIFFNFSTMVSSLLAVVWLYYRPSNFLAPRLLETSRLRMPALYWLDNAAQRLLRRQRPRQCWCQSTPQPSEYRFVLVGCLLSSASCTIEERFRTQVRVGGQRVCHSCLILVCGNGGDDHA